MATVIFIGTENDLAYAIRFEGKKFHFVGWGKEYEVPDELKELVISNHPEMFGEAENDIYQVRGVPVPEKVTTPKKRVPKKEPPKHPFTKALQKVAGKKKTPANRRRKTRAT